MKDNLEGLVTRKKNGSPKIQDPQEQWLFNVKEVLNAPRQEVLWSFIVKGVNNALVASSEAGKSTLLMNLALAIALKEKSFLGWILNFIQWRVVYVATEDGISQLKSKLTAMLKEVPEGDVPEDGILFIFEGNNLAERLDQVLSKNPADLVIIDTWGDLVAGKYDAEFTRRTMSEIKQVCVKYGSTPLYVHHTNKASENIPEKASIKGAGDFEQACRAVMMLSVYKDSRWLCCVKGNPFPDDYKNTCYQLGFNFETQIIFRTGKEESRHEIIKMLRSENLGRSSTEVDWLSILDGEQHGYSNLVAVLVQTGISEPTAKRKIRQALKDGDLQKDANGLYRQ